MAVAQDMWPTRSKNAVTAVVPGLPVPVKGTSKLREDIIARSEKSKVRCAEVRATVDVIKMQTERKVTQANGFFLVGAGE